MKTRTANNMPAVATNDGSLFFFPAINKAANKWTNGSNVQEVNDSQKKNVSAPPV